MVSLNGAFAAYTIYPQAAGVTNQIAAVNQALADNAYIGAGSLTINDPVTGVPVQMTILTLTAAESAQFFNTMITVLTARQTAFDNEIAAIT